MLKKLLLIITATAIVACASVQTTKSGAVGVNRKQYISNNISSSELNKAVAQEYTNFLQEANKANALNVDPSSTTRVRTIANRLIAQTQIFRDDALSWDWDINVVKSKELNAWCMPGGKIVVYSGIIDTLKLTDDEIAFLLGHEIAHALREHSLEAMSRASVSSTISTIGDVILSTAIDVDLPYEDLINATMQYAINLPNSRQNETEADFIGVELASRAGYNPNASISLWQKMQSVPSDYPPEFLSTHPSSSTRIKTLKKVIPKVEKFYKQ